MSSNLFKHWGRSFAVRLTLGYALIFTLSAVVLFGCSTCCWPPRWSARTAKSSTHG
jgi:hypothetical protein